MPYTPIFLLLTGGVVSTEISDSSEKIAYIALIAFFPPWFIAIRFIQHRTKERILKSLTATKMLRFCTAILFAAMAAYGGMGYVSLANALTGSATPIMVEGPVIEKKSYSGKWAGARRLATIIFDNRKVSFNLTAEDYNRVIIGGLYGQEMKLGGLGCYYRWGRSYWI